MLNIYIYEKANISERLKNIYKLEELIQSSTVRNFRTVRQEGNRQIARNLAYYNHNRFSCYVMLKKELDNVCHSIITW